MFIVYLFAYTARFTKTLVFVVSCLSIFVANSSSLQGSIKPAATSFSQVVTTPHTSMAVVIHGLLAQEDKLCKTIISLLGQDYQDWHATCSLIDSSSSSFMGDSNSEKTKEVLLSKLEQLSGLSSKKLQEKIKITLGTELSCPLYKSWSLYNGDTIVVNMRPGDVLTHNHALSTIAQAHKAPDILLTYGSYIITNVEQPIGQLVNGYKIDRAWPENKLRLQLFGKGTPGYPVAFKAKLTRFIKLEDLFYGNNFFAFSTPEAYWYPLYELARDNSGYIEEPLVISEPQGTRSRKDSVFLQHIIRAKPYGALDKDSINIPGNTILINDNALRTHAQNARVILLAYSKDRPLQLYAFLESLSKHVSGSYSATVIYYATNKEYTKAYQEVAQAYPRVKFVAQPQSNTYANSSTNTSALNDFKALTLRELYMNSSAEYVLFAVDDLIVKAPVALSTCIYFLEKTQATSFHLRLGKNITYNYMRHRDAEQPPLYEIGHDVLLWKSNESSGGWHYPYSLDMSLYRKKDIKRALENLGYQTPNKLEEQWAFSVKRSHINLCFRESKTINVPLNIVQKECPDNRHMNLYSPEELLKLFNKNLKIDIESWYALRPASPHVPLKPSFVQRNSKR